MSVKLYELQVGLPATAIEKDWWVTLVLGMVFATEFAGHLVFKGGTSLSKGWKLIERFSEDIDLAIDRKFLGYEGDLSKTQVTKLRKASCAFITNKLAKSISDKIEVCEVNDLTLSIQEFHDSDKDPVIVELQYKSITNKVDYLKPRVLIEIGARSLIEPQTDRGIKSIVGEQFSEKEFADTTVSIPTVLPKRTFLEKAFLLHEEFQKPTDKIRVDRLSRHLYDLEMLSQTKHAEDALNDKELYDSIIIHREKFNSIKNIEYENHKPDKITFIPPKTVIKAWEQDYKDMQENMIYGNSKSFEELLDSLKDLIKRFRKI